MILIIDQGNTLLKIALFHEDQLIELKTLKRATVEQVSILIDSIVQKHANAGRLEGAIWSSVVEDDHVIAEALKSRIKFIKLDTSLPLPIKIKYKTPRTLGNDRVALAVGAINQHPNSNILVIDAGTCITYDFIDKDGEYWGGSISPGISMRFKALHTFTSKLPLVNQIDNPDLIGNTTDASIQSGVINGTRAEVNGIIQKYENQFPSLKVILTGGDLKYFDKNTKSNIFAISNLILLGLKEIFKYNAKFEF